MSSSLCRQIRPAPWWPDPRADRDYR
jgi:hypothetical protein